MNEFPPLPAFPRNRSFRLGVTSYVYPSDVQTNIRALGPVVDDIELVFFESIDFSNIPSREEISGWKDLADIHGLTYTVHFPIDRALGSPDKSEREACLSMILQLIRLCQPLSPHGWILHLEGIHPEDSTGRIRTWQQDLRPLLQTLASTVNDPRDVCVENLGYPFEWCEPLLMEFPFSVCLDFGHLWQMNYDWKSHVSRWLPRTRILHLYGTDHTSRHYSLTRSPIPLIREALQSIGNYRDVLTLETFGYEETQSSMERLAECLGASIPS